MSMRVRTTRTSVFASALLALLAAVPAGAQEIVPVTLTLDEAIRIARQNNPGFQRTRNDLHAAEWDVRAAYGALIPSANISSGISWQGSGEQRFGSLTFDELGVINPPSFWFSSYNLGFSYTIDGQTLMAPGQAKANRNATAAQIQNADAQLVQQVTQLYLDVLRQTEEVRVAEQQLERARTNLRLSQGQFEIGTATAVDVGQAEVAVGRAEVTLLQAQNAHETARIRLLQAMGVDLDQAVTPTTPFRIEEPRWTVDELFELGVERNPNLRSLRASVDAARYGVR
ncbi:MAG: TolC family protein, partial [Gemmatimonadetes bacterium]